MSLSEDSDAAMNETLRRPRLIIDSSSDSEGDQRGAATPNRDALDGGSGGKQAMDDPKKAGLPADDNAAPLSKE